MPDAQRAPRLPWERFADGSPFLRAPPRRAFPGQRHTNRASRGSLDRNVLVCTFDAL